MHSTQLSANTKLKAFYAQQKYFEYGNQSSQLLKHMARQQTSSSIVTKIVGADGVEVRPAGNILTCFYEFYMNM